MLTLGNINSQTGNVTTLNMIQGLPPRRIEQNVGYRPGRLASGYWILILKAPLGPEDFEFDGNTMRSGGRDGLPASTLASDEARRRIHDTILTERGIQGYRDLQKLMLLSVSISGPERLCRVQPVERVAGDFDPSVEYPMGGGGLQWKLIRPKPFLAALMVDAQGMATAPTFTARVDDNAPYDNRAKVRNWLISA